MGSPPWCTSHSRTLLSYDPHANHLRQSLYGAIMLSAAASPATSTAVLRFLRRPPGHAFAPHRVLRSLHPIVTQVLHTSTVVSVQALTGLPPASRHKVRSMHARVGRILVLCWGGKGHAARQRLQRWWLHTYAYGLYRLWSMALTAEGVEPTGVTAVLVNLWQSIARTSSLQPEVVKRRWMPP